MKKSKFYVVWEGREQGVFNSWEKCKESIDGFRGARYKSFPTREEADKAFIEGQSTSHPKMKKEYAFSEEFVKELLGKGHIVIFTDGGALGNPGKGGYGAVLQFLKNGKIVRKEISGGFRNTTNNRMEISAVIKALESLKTKDLYIDVFSDSKYVVDANNKNWAKKWKSNGWIKSDKEEAKNIDLWETLLKLTEEFKVSFYWVKGHSGVEENERCDELANIEMAKNELPIDEVYENSLI